MRKILLLLSFIITTANADVYKWTDKDGNVHFGDRPPEQLDSKVVTQKSINSGPKTTSKTDTWEADYQRAKKEKTLAKNKKEKHDNTVNAICDQMKSQFAVLTQSGRIYTMSANGERSYKSSEEIDKNKLDLNKSIKKNCR